MEASTVSSMQRRRDDRQGHREKGLPLARAIDASRFDQIGRNRLQGRQDHQAVERESFPGGDQDDREERQPLVEQPGRVFLDPGEERGEDIHHPEIRVEHPEEDEDRRHVREGPRHGHQPPRHGAAPELAIEHERREETEPDGHHDDRQHVDQRRPHHRPERRVSQHASVVGEPDPALLRRPAAADRDSTAAPERWDRR